MFTVRIMSITTRRRVFFHLGSPKTGTTYLQEILWRNRDALRRAGLLYPGDCPEAHFQAAMDLQGTQFQADWNDADVPSAWHRIVQQARQFSGDAVLSHELFCTAAAEDIERAMADLAFAEVHVVCTARDLARQLPAVWQEDVKNRHVVSFSDFSAGVRGGTAQPHWLSELFWQRQDLPAILRKWAAGLPPEHVHVVTVPRPGEEPERLWERFAGLLGVDPASFDAQVSAPNKSLGIAETALLSRLNETLADRLDWPSYDSVVKYQLATEIFGARASRRRIALPAEDRSWVQDEAKRLVSELSTAGYDVIGDLDELLPATSRRPGTHDHPDDAEDREVLDAAVEALGAILERHAELERAIAVREPLSKPKRLRGLCARYAVLAKLRNLYRCIRIRLSPVSRWVPRGG